MLDSLYIKAAKCQDVERPPIWIMRQAGRFLPEYRALKEQYPFLTLIKTPDLATEVTLMPIDRFGMDAAILFSDILVIADIIGYKYDFVEKIGPVFETPIRSTKQVNELRTQPAKECLSYVIDTIRQLKPELQKRKTPLIGFSGAPFTLATYLIEGQVSKQLHHIRKMMYQDPTHFHQLLTVLADCVTDYLNAQIEAGVDALQIFDTWAGLLPPKEFVEFSVNYMQKIISGLNNPDKIPITVFCKNSSHYIPQLLDTNANVIGIDWTGDLSKISPTIPKNIAIQGNLDPYLLFADEDRVIKEVKTTLSLMKQRNGYIFNLGHGILPDTNPDIVKKIVETIQEMAPDLSPTTP
ncbi:MAG: uroporphyrinogen decarboxylase [Candidatus Marinamargulisbacteria bacterium]|jgi:uroporphyrinogen decarboxylase